MNPDTRKDENPTSMKICLITGANSGIGKAAAIQIARRGYRVVMACRNRGRGEAALEEIKEQSGRDSVDLMIVDMSLQGSVRDFAERFTNSYEALDVLIQNAAIFDITKKEKVFTEEGNESIWATNHLGPVLLTELLIDSLDRSPQGRILTVASKGLVAMPFLKVDLEDPEFRDRKFSVTKAYYQSKTAQVMYTYWLSERLKGSSTTSNCIRVPSVRVDVSKYPNLPRFLRTLYSLKMKFALTPEEMARTYTYLATSNELIHISGVYFNEKHRPVNSSKYSRDPENVEQVMKLTMGYVGLTGSATEQAKST